MIDLHNADCFNVMDELHNDEVSFDAIITDPPYNMKKADWDTFKTHDDFLKFTFGWIDKAIKLLTENGNLLIFNTPFNSAFILQYLNSKGLFFRNWIVYNKRDGQGAAKRQFKSQQEVCLYFSNSNKHTFNFNDVRLPYDRGNDRAKCGVIKNGKRWFPNPNGKICDDVWQFTAERHLNKVNGKTQKQLHLTPKPLAMMQRIVKATTNEYDTVLDPFMGSGTTGVACKNTNRNFKGIELDPTYFNIARDKLTDDTC